MTEIEKIAEDQLSHSTDLPKARRQRINGNRKRFYEIPFDPGVLDEHDWNERFLTGWRMLNECGDNESPLIEDRICLS